MKKILFFVFLFIYGQQIMVAQHDTSISGQVFDQSTQGSIPFASVSVFNIDNQLINGTITEDDGHFVIQGLKPDNYKISISFLSYETYQTDILIGVLNKNYSIGKIELKPSTTELEAVSINKTKSEISKNLDKKSFNMSNQIAQSGGSIMDAMKAMPSVSFDQDGKVILRGSDKVIVLIDGKQSSLTGFGNQKGLDNIPASNIEKIEIINNPSAKYDANGMAGIINIIYKKTKQDGLHGSIGFAYGLGALTKRKEDLPTELGSFSPTPKYIPSLDLNYRKNKLAAYLQNEVIVQERLPNNEFTTRFYDDGRIIASQVPENRKQTHYIFKGGVDYDLNGHDRLSFSGIFDIESHVDSAQVPYIDVLTGNRNRFIAWNEEETTGYINFASHYEHKFKQNGHQLDAHLQYSRGWEDETYFINDSTFVRPNGGRDITTVIGTEHTTSFSLDYTKPLATGRIETGAKLRIRSLPVTYEQQRGTNSILYEGLGEYTKWGESIYAAYANWVHEKNNYDIEAGLRAEYTSVFYDIDEENIYYEENDKYDYFRLFPNVRVSYKFDKRNKISIFYNQRVDRPGEPELRLFAKSDDHELVKVGNPYLRPQFTQSAEVGYKTNWNKGAVFISGYYRFIEDAYQRVLTQDETNTDFDVILKSYANTGKSTNAGIEIVLDQQISHFWKLSGNINIYQNKIDAFTGTLSFPNEHTFTIENTTDNTADFKLINTFSLPKNIQLQLTSIYLAPKNIPQGNQSERSSIDFGVKKKLWQGKGEIVFAATDIFNRFGLKQEIKGNGFNAIYENYYETQTLRLGLKYKF